MSIAAAESTPTAHPSSQASARAYAATGSSCALALSSHLRAPGLRALPSPVWAAHQTNLCLSRGAMVCHQSLCVGARRAHHAHHAHRARGHSLGRRDGWCSGPPVRGRGSHGWTSMSRLRLRGASSWSRSGGISSVFSLLSPLSLLCLLCLRVRGVRRAGNG